MIDIYISVIMSVCQLLDRVVRPNMNVKNVPTFPYLHRMVEPSVLAIVRRVIMRIR